MVPVAVDVAPSVGLFAGRVNYDCGLLHLARLGLRACEKIDFPRKICIRWQLAKEQEKKALHVRAASEGDRCVFCWETTGAFGISRSVREPIGLRRR